MYLIYSYQCVTCTVFNKLIIIHKIKFSFNFYLQKHLDFTTQVQRRREKRGCTSSDQKICLFKKKIFSNTITKYLTKKPSVKYLLTTYHDPYPELTGKIASTTQP